MKRAALSLGMAAMLAACVSSGTKVTPDQVAQFDRGRSTMAEVIRRLGPANSTTTLSNGLTILVYSYISATPNAATFVPVVGALAGGATGTSNTATFTFDAAGVLLNSGSSESNTAVSTGLLNQR